MLVENSKMIYRGSDELARVYRGDTVVWEPGTPHDYSQDYLTFTVHEVGGHDSSTYRPRLDIDIYNGGSVEVSKRFRFRYTRNGVHFLPTAETNYGTQYAPNITAVETDDWFYVNQSQPNAVIHVLVGDTIEFNNLSKTESGNISVMSMQGVGDYTVYTASGNLYKSFASGKSYGQKFFSLPYTLNPVYNAENIYIDTRFGTLKEMFDGCQQLIRAPKVIPYTQLFSSYCERMFSGCISLKTAPRITATLFSDRCCYQMFAGCARLRNAPVLHADYIQNSGCYEMFVNCANLQYVKCLATSFGSNACYRWLSGVSQTGTFVKDASATWDTGESGIPSGWTVVDA